MFDIGRALLDLEALQRELHAAYRLIRGDVFPPENHPGLLAAMKREGELRMSVRQWLEWQGKERRRPFRHAGVEG